METQQVNPKSQNLENSWILLKDLLDPKQKKFKTQNEKGDLISISHFASKQINVRSTFPNGSSKKKVREKVRTYRKARKMEQDMEGLQCDKLAGAASASHPPYTPSPMTNSYLQTCLHIKNLPTILFCASSEKPFCALSSSTATQSHLPLTSCNTKKKKLKLRMNNTTTTKNNNNNNNTNRNQAMV
jgi:hypothetical protein